MRKAKNEQQTAAPNQRTIITLQLPPEENKERKKPPSKVRHIEFIHVRL